jgi:hypothetical protein
MKQQQKAHTEQLSQLAMVRFELVQAVMQSLLVFQSSIIISLLPVMNVQKR